MTDSPVTESNHIPIKFGTDGWRAAIADDFTVANVRVCAQALADDMVATGTAADGLVVAWDTRFGSEMFARAVADVAMGNGIAVTLGSAPMPTPAASFAVVHTGAGAGVVITASHNPAADNGFKVKSALGASASPEIIARIEERIPAIYRKPSLIKTTKTTKNSAGRSEPALLDVRDEYLRAVTGLVDIDAIRAAGFNIAVESMYGAGGGYLPQVLAGGATTVMEIHGSPNPAFPGMSQPEPVERNLSGLMAAVMDFGPDVCIALDGDADRVGVVNERGTYLSTLDVFSVIVHHLLKRRGWTGPIVTTITQSTMIQRLAEKYGQQNPRTPVGFKYVGPLMIESDAIAGGEESGGYAYRGHVPERDGILSGLLFLDAMVASGKTPSELLDEVHEVTGPFVFGRLDLNFDPANREEIFQRVQNSQPTSIAGLAVEEIDRQDGTRFLLAEGAWTLARFSGTEPLLRIYAEAQDATTRDRLIAEVKTVALGN